MKKMLMLYLFDTIGKNNHETAKQLGQNLVSMMQNKFESTESQTALTMSTLLDPRFEAIGFNNQGQAQAAVRRLTAQCFELIRNTTPPTHTEEQPSTSAQPAPAETATSHKY